MNFKKLAPVLGLFTALFFSPAAKAALVVNSVASNATSVTVSATWTNQDPGTVISNTGAPYWDLDLISFAFAPGAGVLSVTAQHTVAPDAGESVYGPSLILSFFGVSPGVGAATKATGGNHPLGMHNDMLTVSINPLVANVSSTVSITASHVVPEPGSLGLGLLGGGILLATRRRLFRQS